MPPPPLPKTPSPTKRSSQVQPIQSPIQSAAKVPLPQTPTRRPVPPATTTPSQQTERQQVSGVGISPRPPETPQSPRLLNDDFLQQSIASDMSQYMKGLAIQDKPIAAPKLAPYSSQPQSTEASSLAPAASAPLLSAQTAATTQERAASSTNDLFQKPLPSFAPPAVNGSQSTGLEVGLSNFQHAGIDNRVFIFKSSLIASLTRTTTTTTSRSHNIHSPHPLHPPSQPNPKVNLPSQP